MEKRFALFLVLAALVLFLHMMYQNALAPRKPVADKPPEDAGAAPADEDAGGQDDGAPKDPSKDAEDEVEGKPKPKTQTPDVPDPADPEEVREKVANERVTLGSMDPNCPYRLLVTFNSQGAAVERIELTERSPAGTFRFRELNAKAGYLGHLGLGEPNDECRVNVVGPGTPAAKAGLKPEDVIKQVRLGDDSDEIKSVADFKDFMATTKPGQTIGVSVSRPVSAGATVTRNLPIELIRQPLSIIRPEGSDPKSFLFALESVGGKSVKRGSDELAGLPSLREENWEVVEIKDDGKGPAVEFHFLLDDLKEIGVEGKLELVKRYRLARTPDAELDNNTYKSYHLTLEIEIHNKDEGAADQQIAYRLDGPNGLPLEGWWYSNKIHPTKFSAAGARDVLWSTPKSGHGLMGTMAIYSETIEAKEKNETASLTLFPDDESQELDYLGVDTQFFTVALKPVPLKSETGDDTKRRRFKQAIAMPVGDVGEKKKSDRKTINVSFRLISDVHTITAGKAHTQEFILFAGPKQPKLLAEYELEECIAYGWFGMVAKPLSAILHWFEWLPLVNYGLAIIMLTVLVRSCMIPLSRKAAKNAQMMQALAPEMKRIAEQYKNDMEKRAASQRELFAKHNYNPFGGCLLMFVQLPIFIGLYRSLSVDVELRQAPLIPGVEWCSNLAGPDMLFYWQDWMPGFLASESGGWLGPYFNILPIFTIVLFLAQQKMFMPPATDDQSRMQQKVMKFMMIFMGFLFFRVASGLCVYFIASSLWGIAERKLLPPPGKVESGAPTKTRKQKADAEAKKAKLKKRQKKR
ncbi:MAG: YidC/Oxa1 family insertase periplasmic-domain containing protein [Planctomycetes bacterium]|nr:YidC/Oxa1 family insertase periplasmic-domain containing protein [Planctomycetota bacterium]MBL7037938.1 YidC/Oxa1 family insertase periplasmic-domain containing protein [Pirellulaceae bacterium]